MNFFMAGHALIEKDSKYLVTRRSQSNTYMPLKWDLPGGIVQHGETVEDGIFREVREETGLTISIGHVVYIYANRDQLPNRQTFQAVYVCRFVRGEVQLNISEHDLYKWLDYDDIANLDLIDFLRELVGFYRPTISDKH